VLIHGVAERSAGARLERSRRRHQIADAELLAVPHMGHEYLPPDAWDLVVPAILAISR
jgi:hypothetical protein